MIDVEQTLLDTIIAQVNELRFHAHDDPNCWKKIIYLTILNDLYDWSYYREDKVEIQNKLKQLRIDFILKNPMFGIVHKPYSGVYTNVNTPQNNDTWKRVWDNINVIYAENVELSRSIDYNDPENLKYEPNPTCTTKLIYLPYGDKIVMGENTPIVQKHLTTCEKMNIYVDTETNKAYYLTSAGIWQLLNTNDNLQEEDIKRMIKKYEDKGIKYNINSTDPENSILVLDTPSEDYDAEVEDEFGTAMIPILTDKDDDDLNSML